MNAHVAKPAIGLPATHGWQEGQSGLEPILFEGLMSSDFLQDLICTCKGKSVCSKSCVCFEQGLSCTDLCPCQGTDLCHNVQTRQVDDDDDEQVQIDKQRKPLSVCECAYKNKK